MTIPFIDLQAQYQVLQPQIQERINRVLEHGQYIMGPEVLDLHRVQALHFGREWHGGIADQPHGAWYQAGR